MSANECMKIFLSSEISAFNTRSLDILPCAIFLTKGCGDLLDRFLTLVTVTPETKQALNGSQTLAYSSITHST